MNLSPCSADGIVRQGLLAIAELPSQALTMESATSRAISLDNA
jgi:hypothetical protein